MNDHSLPIYCSNEEDKDVIRFLRSGDVETLAWKVRMMAIDRRDKFDSNDHRSCRIIIKYFVKDVLDCESAILDAKKFFNIIPESLKDEDKSSWFGRILNALKFI